jgi:hypothetical protein
VLCPIHLLRQKDHTEDRVFCHALGSYSCYDKKTEQQTVLSPRNLARQKKPELLFGTLCVSIYNGYKGKQAEMEFFKLLFLSMKRNFFFHFDIFDRVVSCVTNI